MSNQAEIYKAQGNAALQARQFEDAVDLYSKAIALDPSNHIFFSNRAAAFASLERWREALDDSYEVVTLKPDWVKGWVRRGGAFTGLGQHEEARKAYVKAANIEPGNEQVQQLLKAAEAAVAKTKEKNWEDDLWSDDDDEGVGKQASSNGGGGGGSSAAAAGGKRGAPPGSGAFDDDGDDCSAHGVKRPRRKPSASLVSQLDRSLKDASEDSLRACLGQIAASDEALAERALHILEGLNAASSAGEDDGDDDGSGDDRGGAAAAWLKASVGGARGKRRGRGGMGDSDSD